MLNVKLFVCKLKNLPLLGPGTLLTMAWITIVIVDAVTHRLAHSVSLCTVYLYILVYRLVQWCYSIVAGFYRICQFTYKFELKNNSLNILRWSKFSCRSYSYLWNKCLLFMALQIVFLYFVFQNWIPLFTISIRYYLLNFV